MKIDQLLENEKENLLDYLFTYCEKPLETASEDLKALLKDFDAYDTRTILEENYITSYYLSSVPGNTDSSIWLDIGEIEIPTDEIEPEEIDDYTINGEYAYYYVGYGLMIEFNIEGIKQSIKDMEE